MHPWTNDTLNLYKTRKKSNIAIAFVGDLPVVLVTVLPCKDRVQKRTKLTKEIIKSPKKNHNFLSVLFFLLCDSARFIVRTTQNISYVEYLLNIY